MLLIPAVLSAANPTVSPLVSPTVTEMSLTTPDGFVLKGTLTVPAAPASKRHARPRPCPVVLLAHQFMADRGGWKPLAEKLNAAGIATLALDLRGHGASTQQAGKEVKVTDDFLASAKAVSLDKIPADLTQAAAWLRHQPGIDGRRLGLAGSSVGAFATLMASAKIRPIAVLALSPAGNGAFGPNATPALARAVETAKSAVMVMASRQDEDANQNATALRPIPGVYARFADGKEHGFDYLAAQSDTMAVFLTTYLKDHARKPAAPKSEEPATNPES